MRNIAFISSLIVSILFWTACGPRRMEPNIMRIYDRPAKSHGQKRNPVIVIPGILGSKLVDRDSGKIAWGAFGGEYVDPSSPEGLRLIAFPIADDIPLSRLQDSLYPDGALDRVEIEVFGLPISLNAYFELLNTLGAGGYRDQALAEMAGIDYGDDHISCFQFAYDWRKDIATLAADFEGFLEEKRAFLRKAYRERYGEVDEIKFDVVAHSMGGLIARYYLRYGSKDVSALNIADDIPWSGEKDMGKLILVGTPNAGSADVFMAITQGRSYSPLHPHYPAALLASMPSLYGLLPRPRHRHILWSSDDGTAEKTVDIYDQLTWKSNSWGLYHGEQQYNFAALLPDHDTHEQRERSIDLHLQKILSRTKAIHEALDRSPDVASRIPITLIAGDAADTSARLEVQPNSIEHAVLETAPGDGIVLRSSALMDERTGAEWVPYLQSPIAFHNVLFLFEDHLGLTRAPSFADNLLFDLLEKPRADPANAKNSL